MACAGGGGKHEKEFATSPQLREMPAVAGSTPGTPGTQPYSPTWEGAAGSTCRCSTLPSGDSSLGSAFNGQL